MMTPIELAEHEMVQQPIERTNQSLAMFDCHLVVWPVRLLMDDEWLMHRIA